MIKSLKSSIKRLFRQGFELLGSEKYSHPSLYNMDRQLLEFLPSQPGIFIEVGANNGYSQSNTYYLERFKSWTGILVEPIPDLYNECVKERKNSRVFNYALVASDYGKDYVEIHSASLMSVVNGILNNEKEHLAKASEFERDLEVKLLKVPAKTLTSIIEECNIDKIDFLSLDVEGYELEVLKGLDFNRFAPCFILAEANNRSELEDFLLSKYDIIKEFSGKDILYKKKGHN